MIEMHQRQLSDGFNAQERRTDAIVNGICDLGYTQQSLNNATNMAMMSGGLTPEQQEQYKRGLLLARLLPVFANLGFSLTEYKKTMTLLLQINLLTLYIRTVVRNYALWN